MAVLIEKADNFLFEAAGNCDFSFDVEAFYKPVFDQPVAEWRRIAVASYRKSYDNPNGPAGQAREGSAMFVAILNGDPVGRLSVCRNWNGYGLLDHFGVERPHRSGGIGRRLFEQARAWAQAERLPGLMLETQNNNIGACRFYERQGFTLGGIDRFLYRGIDADTREIALFWYLPFDAKPAAA